MRANIKSDLSDNLGSNLRLINYSVSRKYMKVGSQFVLILAIFISLFHLHFDECLRKYLSAFTSLTSPRGVGLTTDSSMLPERSRLH